MTGWETLCESQRNSGYSVDGAWAEYAVADDRYVVSVPDGIPPLDAAPLTCAGVTTFKAVKVSGIQPAETAVVYGVGGLGHLALQYATLFGGKVIAVDIEDSKLELASQLGAAERLCVVAPRWRTVTMRPGLPGHAGLTAGSTESEKANV